MIEVGLILLLPLGAIAMLATYVEYNKRLERR